MLLSGVTLLAVTLIVLRRLSRAWTAICSARQAEPGMDLGGVPDAAGRPGGPRQPGGGEQPVLVEVEQFGRVEQPRLVLDRGIQRAVR
jgi:hypothetical protein